MSYLFFIFFYIKYPKRLNTEDVKAIFERYGYTVPDNFVYQNNSTSIHVYDE